MVSISASNLLYLLPEDNPEDFKLQEGQVNNISNQLNTLIY